MAKFLILYHSPMTAAEQMKNSTEEQVKASMEEWIKWKNEAVKTVGFEFGMPLQIVSEVKSDSVKDGNSTVGGYSFMEADSKDSIIEVLKSHPHLKHPGTSIDVLEMISMPGM